MKTSLTIVLSIFLFSNGFSQTPTKKPAQDQLKNEIPKLKKDTLEQKQDIEVDQQDSVKVNESSLSDDSGAQVIAEPSPKSRQAILRVDTIIEQPIVVKYYRAVAPNDTEPRKKRKREGIKTLTGRMSHSGGFGALAFKSSDFKDKTMILSGLRGGWIVNRTLALGMEAYGIIPTTKHLGLDPDPGQEVRVLGGYGGMFLEPIFFSNEVVHITFPVSAGAGWMGYERVDGNNPLDGGDGLLDDDVYWYAEPGVALEVNIARNFRLNFGVSKRFTQDLDLINTESDDFDQVSYNLSLKVGGF